MLSLFVALAHSPLGEYMQSSKWGFALVETVHLLALAILGGSVLMVDLRLLGLILPKESAKTVGKDLSKLLLVSLFFLVLSGVAMLSEEALKCYHNPAFRWKMALLIVAIVFYFTLHRKALINTDKQAPTPWSRAAAVISLALWLGVGVAGRAIGLI